MLKLFLLFIALSVNNAFATIEYMDTYQPYTNPAFTQDALNYEYLMEGRRDVPYYIPDYGNAK